MQNLFGQIDTISGKRSILINSGVDNHFVNNLDFSLNINEFVSILIYKFIDYKVSSRRENYHPMIVFIDYILKRDRQYNLDDEELEIFRKILTIGKKKIKALFD